MNQNTMKCRVLFPESDVMDISSLYQKVTKIESKITRSTSG